MNKTKVYISGKITGLSDLNAPSFNRVENELIKKGYEPFNPIKIKGENDWQWEDYMKPCITALMSCDYIYMIDGWETSKGAMLEMYIASLLNIPAVFEGEQIQ